MCDTRNDLPANTKGPSFIALHAKR